MFGDGSGQEQGGIMGALLGAGKRVLTGENLFTTVLQNQGRAKAKAAFAAPYPGTVLALLLSNMAGRSSRKRTRSCVRPRACRWTYFSKENPGRPVRRRGLYHAETDRRWLGVFLHVGGTFMVQLIGRRAQTLHVDTGCVAAISPGVGFDVNRRQYQTP